MTYLNRYGKQQGIGLIEVLIATVVIAVGLLAVASLQGKFMSSSGTTKTSAQAIKLAEAKIEEFRNNNELKNTTTSGGFFYRASGTDTIAGSNATFTRTWTITNLTNADGTTDPTRKRILVNVTWPPATANESVNIVSQFAWLNPGNSSYYAAGATGSGVMARAPDPSQNSSTPGAAPGQPPSYSPGTGTPLGDGSNLSTHTDGQGNTVLLNAGGTVKQTYYGGIINSISGTVYTANDFTNLTVAVSETAGICIYTSSATSFGSGTSSGQRRNYICYTGGNCLHSAGLNGCPASPTASQLAAQNYVGPGGWYGNVGFLGLGVSGGTQEKVCFVPVVSGFSAREYSSVRTSSGVVSSEGINRSFSCHDFLVVNQSGQKSDCATVITDFGMSPEPQKITRTLMGDSTAAPNTVLSEDTTYCSVTPSHSITVTLTGGSPTSGTLVVAPASGSGSCTGSGTSYTCTVPDSVAGGLSFTGSTSTGSCTGTGSYVASSSAQAASLTIACTATRNITVTTAPVGTGTVSGITVSGPGATCTGLTCTVAYGWTDTLTATGTCSGSPASVSGTATIASAATTAGIALGNCTASVPTYSITTTAAGGSGLVTSSTCNGGSCSALVAGSYTVIVWLNGGNTCSGSYTISANKAITVTKATGQGMVCTMTP